MQKRSDRSSRRPAAAAPTGKGRPVMQLEGLEDRRLMSVVTPAKPQTAVRLETSLGRITLLLSPDVTPLTVANFLHYVNGEGDKKNLYNGTIVHRSIPGFVIQLGGYKAGTSGYTHIPTQDPVHDEFDRAKAAVNNGDVNTRGTVALALSGGNNDSGQSEFFINLANNAHTTGTDPTTHLPLPDNGLDVQSGGFTTFAKVIGGGMHVADAIAGLKTTNASFLNPAFSDLPVIQTVTGPNPVTLSSAKAQSSLVVRLDDKTHFVTWVDEKGGTTTVTLSKGTADLTFVGGNDMQVVDGNHIFITGKNVTLEDLTTHGTTKSSVLAIKSTGGNGPAHIGNVTVANGSLGSIAANTIQLQGDITAATGSIGSIDLQGTYRSTILTNGGSLSLKIGTAFDTSVNTKGTLKSLIAQKWQDDGQIGTTSIVAGSLGSMEVNGNFSSTISTTGDVNRIKINGNVGTLGTSTWSIGGDLKTVQVGKVMGLRVNVSKDLSTFTAREVLSSDDGATTVVSARSIGRMTLATLTNQSTIAARNGNIGNVAIAGLMDSSIIRATGNIGSVSALSMAGTNPGTAAGTLTPSGIFAGIPQTTATPTGYVTNASIFPKKSTATIGTVKVRKTFSNTNIAAPIVQNLNLGKVQSANPAAFGVTAHIRIGQLNATVKGKTVALNNATTDEAVKNYFESIGLPIKPFAKQGDGDRFNVSIV